MSNLLLLAGIPGSGKSTWASNLFWQEQIISSDAIREELGDINDQNKNDLVFTIFHDRIARRLTHSWQPVVADSTALTRHARENLIRIAREHDASVHLILFGNIDQATYRNSQRERVVPAEAMNRMIVRYHETVRDLVQEDFDTVTRINNY